MPQCPNCSAVLTDPYCEACGQRAIDPRDLSSRRLVSELTDEVGSLGSRMNTARRLHAAVADCYAFIALRRAYPQSIPWILLKSAAMIGPTLTFNPVADALAIR